MTCSKQRISKKGYRQRGKDKRIETKSYPQIDKIKERVINQWQMIKINDGDQMANEKSWC